MQEKSLHHYLNLKDELPEEGLILKYQDISHHDAEKDEYLMTLIRMPTAEEVINSFYKKNPKGFMDMDTFDNEVDIFIEKEKRKLMNLKYSENISSYDSEDKREVMEKDKEAVVLDMNIKIADAVKPGVDADVMMLLN
ncbi:hypothetical protein Tco_0789079 [Tanacetum coccineum]